MYSYHGVSSTKIEQVKALSSRRNIIWNNSTTIEIVFAE